LPSHAALDLPIFLMKLSKEGCGGKLALASLDGGVGSEQRWPS
jgi:hypothetical protein